MLTTSDILGSKFPANLQICHHHNYCCTVGRWKWAAQGSNGDIKLRSNISACVNIKHHEGEA